MCPEGKSSTYPFQTCDDCPPGAHTVYKSDIESECKACDIGMYSPYFGGDCLLCDSGSTTYHKGSVVCTECQQYQQFDLVRRTCSNCPAGKYSNDGIFCIDCPVGKGLIPGQSACEDCAAGKYSIGYGMLCTNCPQGLYSSETSADFCDGYCPAGKSSPEGSTSSNDCIHCEAGKYSILGSSCTNCNAGRSSAAGASSCTTCNEGEASHSGGPCVSNCGTGYFINNYKMCMACPKGYRCDGINRIQCEAGTFQDDFGKGECKECDELHESA